MDIKKFNNKDFLLIYESNEKSGFAIFQIILIAYIGYNFYNYYHQRYELEIDSVDVYIPFNFGLVMTAFLGMLQYRISKTPVSILLHKSGN